MASYTAPLRDMRFIYNELFESSKITALPGYEDATPRSEERRGGKECRPRGEAQT